MSKINWGNRLNKKDPIFLSMEKSLSFPGKPLGNIADDKSLKENKSIPEKGVKAKERQTDRRTDTN